MNCPICDGEMAVHTDRAGPNIVEQYETCPKGHYGYHFWSGYTTILVGSNIFDYNIHDSSQQIQNITYEVNRKIEELKGVA